jgi:hypothetical protein
MHIMYVDRPAWSVAAGAAHVALLDHAELAAQALLGHGEALVVGDLLGALLGHDHLVEDLVHPLVASDLGEQLGTEVRSVHRGDADGDRPRGQPVGRHLRRPLRLLEHRAVGAGDEVEPVPAAVAERRQRQLEGEVLGVGTGRVCGVDPLRTPVGHRPVDDHRRVGTGGRHVEGHRVDDGPPAPVAGREPVEVGAERDPLVLVHPVAATVEDGVRIGLHRGVGLGRRQLAALRHGEPALVDVELRPVEVDVQRQHVGVTVGGQHHPLQDAARGLGSVLGARGCGHSSTPPLSRVAPDSKWGLSLFSYMERAEPIAMCMSRYL